MSVGGVSRLPTPWQQMQTMDSTFSNALSGNTDSSGTIESMLSGGQDTSSADTFDAISSAMATASQSAFQGYAQLAAQAALTRVQKQASDAQAAAAGTPDASPVVTDAQALAEGPDTPDPLNQSDPTSPFAVQQDVTLDDGTVIKAQTGVDLGDGSTLDPTTGITTMADGSQMNSYGIPVKEMNTMPLDLPPGFIVDTSA